MSLSPSPSTVVASGETSPTGTPPVASQPTDATPKIEDRIPSSCPTVSPEKAKKEENMAVEGSSANVSPISDSAKTTENNDQIDSVDAESGLSSPSSFPSSASPTAGIEAANCRSPNANASRIVSSTSPLPATSPPVPNPCTAVSTEAQQQLISSLGASPTLPMATTLNTSNTCIPITTDDLEEVMLELNNFERQVSDGKEVVPSTIPPILEGYLQFVARGGSTHFPWAKVKWLFKVKLDHVVSEFYSISPTDDIAPAPNVDTFDFASVKEKVFQQLEAFSGIPFTIQRLAELLTAPKRHYRRTDKFMRALEKNMLIVSTVEARVPPPIPDQSVQFPPPHYLPASLHSPTKSINLTILNGQADMDTYMKENELNGPSSRLLGQSSPTHGNEGSMTTASLTSNVSPNRNLTALSTINGNNSLVLSGSPIPASNLSSLNRSSTCEGGDKMRLSSKENAKDCNIEAEFEDEDEDEEEEEDDDSEGVELNVGGVPGDRTDNNVCVMQSESGCSSGHMMEGRSSDNAHFSISSAEGGESLSESQSQNASGTSIEAKLEESDASPTTLNEDRETKKRKLKANSSAAHDGTPNKILVCEKQDTEDEKPVNGAVMVSSQSTGTKEKESFKDGANISLNATETPLDIGMVITSCTASAADQQVNINSSGPAIVSKNISQLEDTFDATSTTEDCDNGKKLPNNTSQLQSRLNSGDARKGLDELDINESCDKTSMEVAADECTDMESNADQTKNTPGNIETDSSVDKPNALPSGDALASEKNKEEDSMEVDAECTDSDSQIRTSSSAV